LQNITVHVCRTMGKVPRKGGSFKDYLLLYSFPVHRYFLSHANRIRHLHKNKQIVRSEFIAIQPFRSYAVRHLLFRGARSLGLSAAPPAPAKDFYYVYRSNSMCRIHAELSVQHPGDRDFISMLSGHRCLQVTHRIPRIFHFRDQTICDTRLCNIPLLYCLIREGTIPFCIILY
jgi:hypothetical protein